MYKLLIVEDDPLIRRSLCRDFPWEEWGFCLSGDVSNGKLALEAVGETHPDAVLTDIRMPVLDGLSLLEQLKSIATPPEVILLSAYDDFYYAQKGLNAGAFAYILKTDVFDEMELTMRRLFSHLQKKNGRSEPAANEDAGARSAVEFVICYLNDHLCEGPTLSEIASRCGLNANYLSQLFRQEKGFTYVSYVKKLRVEKAEELLAETNEGLETIARITGFQTVQYFCRFFRAETGMTPSEYRKRSRSV